MEFLSQHPWAAIIFGTVLVAIGGLMATWGWNKQSEVQQKNHLIISTACEWGQNDQRINEAILLAKRWHERDSNENFSHRLYNTSRLSSLITSGLFSETEIQLIKNAQRYESALESFNSSLQIVGRHNPGLFLKSEFIHENTTPLPDDENSILSNPFQLVVHEHRNLGDFIRNKYTKLIQKSGFC